MSHFYRIFLSGLSLMMAFICVQSAAAAGTITLSVSDISVSDAMVSVDPGDVASYVFNIQSKSTYDAKGGDAGAVQAEIDGWKYYGDLYECSWTDFIELNEGAEEFQASDFLYLDPATEYVAYAFGMDAQGNQTSDVVSTTFTTKEVKKSDITFELKVISVVPDDYGTCTVTASVVPSNGDSYGVLCQKARTVEFYDLTTPEGVQKYLDSQVAGKVNTTYTGEQTVTFQGMNLNANLYLVAVGYDGAPTSAPTMLAFKSTPVTTPALKGSLEITVNDISVSDALITVKPVDVESYVFYLQEKMAYEANGGDAGAVESRIKIWKNYGETYECSWTDFIELNYEVSEFQADDYLTLEPATEYVAVAFGMDAQGNQTSEVFSTAFTTKEVKKSDITFELKVLSVVPDDYGTCTITASVVPSNDDSYGVLCQRARTVEFYDFTTPEGVQKYLDSQVAGKVKTTYTGEQTVTFQGMNFNADLYLVAVGYDGAPTSAPAMLPFRSVPVSETVEYEITVSDIALRDAYISIKPADNDQNYIFGIVTKQLVDDIGGLDNLYEKHDLSWWLFIADTYEIDWTEVAAQDKTTGTVEGLAKDLRGDDPLRWDTDYVVYAYALDGDYAPASKVYYKEFRTLPSYKTDLTFDVQLVSVVADTNPDRAGMNKATLIVTPSNDEEPYANKVMESRYYDFYVDNEDFTMDNFLESQVYPSIVSQRTGTQELTFVNIKPSKTYVLVTLGWNNAPTTDDFNIFRFSGDLYESIGDEAMTAAPTVSGTRGRIIINGEYDGAAVFTTDGRAVGAWRGTSAIDAAPGLYIVKVKAGTRTTTHKVMVR